MTGMVYWTDASSLGGTGRMERRGRHPLHNRAIGKSMDIYLGRMVCQIRVYGSRLAGRTRWVMLWWVSSKVCLCRKK